MEDNGRQGKGSDVLFVYGTLMRSSYHPMARRLEAQSRYLGKGSVAGNIFSLGHFPGMVCSESPQDRVFGEALQLRTPVRSLMWLDEYERCGPRHPEPRDYDRKRVSIRMNSGAEIVGWVYIYKQRVARARLIPGGRFRPI
jgi:gamma-glutamylcyclotransferase (GGCT)/AIG2-like uncharacterized protein YtfP